MGAPPRMDLIVRAETAVNFHEPNPMRRTWWPLATSSRTVSVNASSIASASFKATWALAAIRWASSSLPTILVVLESSVGIGLSILSVRVAGNGGVQTPRCSVATENGAPHIGPFPLLFFIYRAVQADRHDPGVYPKK